MARYIDADKFRQGLIDRQITTQFFNPRERHEIGCIIEMLDNAPEADVVPKSEVEKIFEEIEGVLNSIGFDELDIEALKKKYTEEQK